MQPEEESGRYILTRYTESYTCACEQHHTFRFNSLTLVCLLYSSPEFPDEKEGGALETEGELKSTSSDTVTQEEEDSSCNKEEERSLASESLAPEQQECCNKEEEKRSLASEQQESYTSPFQFHQPAFCDEDFNLKVLQSKVSLEYCVHGRSKSFLGFVLVHNEAYHKKVFIRYTHDNWATFHDAEAHWMCSCSEGASDRFRFTLPMMETDFAICYVVNGQEHWDNNHGHNYHVRPCWSEIHKVSLLIYLFLHVCA